MQVLLSQFGSEAIEQVSQKIGAERSTTEQALQAAVPLLISALSQNASQPDGAEALAQALQRDHSGSILDNVMDFLQNPQTANGAGILRHLLGSQRAPIEQALAERFGLSTGQIGHLLEILSPLVMGALGKLCAAKHLDAGGLSQFLGQQRQQIAAQAPDLMSLATRFLDRNADGSIMDDAANLLSGFLNRRKQ